MSHVPTVQRRDVPRAAPTSLAILVGSGHRIGLFTAPFVVVGLLLNIAFPAVFDVGGPPVALRAASVAVLTVGMVLWAWSAALILIHVPRGQLITTGPFAVVKHPLYTSVALLVLPSLGLLFDSWLGVAIGGVMYIGSRMFAPAEESRMSTLFGERWDRYRGAVRLPWL
jgi:protein-S-isoprenylcysteine O-methyltransferase Ste14